MKTFGKTLSSMGHEDVQVADVKLGNGPESLNFREKSGRQVYLYLGVISIHLGTQTLRRSCSTGVGARDREIFDK